MRIGVFIYLLLCGLSYSTLYAQVPPVYQEHQMFEQYINPAITGRDKSLKLVASYKNYWPNTQNSPYSIAVAADGRIGDYNFYNPRKFLNKSNFLSKDRMAIGGLLMYSGNGPENYFYASGNYAYFIPFDPIASRELSFGLSANILNYSLDYSMFDPLDPGDSELDEETSYWIPDVGFGIYYHTQQFFIGASANELFKTEHPLEEFNETKNSIDYFGQTGYKFYLKRFDLEPSVFTAKINQDPLYYYAQLKGYYKNYNWLYVGYKSTQVVSAGIGFRINRMHVAYVYDHYVGKMGKYFSSAHEIVLGINVGVFEPEGIRKVIKHKR